jgi:hypothetical protein
MQTNKYVKQIYRALVVGCMVYAVTLIADTAAAGPAPAMTQAVCCQGACEPSCAAW